MFTILFYALATYGAWTIGKKVYRLAKRGNIKKQLAESKTMRRLGGRK